MIDFCEWEDDGEGNWDTSCGIPFVLIDGTPDENGMRFCCFCGRLLKQVEFNECPDGGEVKA